MAPAQFTLLERSALLTQLKNPEVAITRLVAGRGYGKSTLMTSLAKETGYYYLTLWDTDPDPLSIVRLMTRKLPMRPASESQLAFELSRPGVTERAAAAALRDELATLAPVTLLIDDAQLLSAEGRRFFTEMLLRHLPAGVRFVFAMHDEDDLPLRSLLPELTVAGLRMEQLGTRDLMFTPDEMTELGLTSEQQTRVQGWPAAALFMRGGVDPWEGARDILLVVEDAEAFLPTLRRAALLSPWREYPGQAAMGLPPGWLVTARRKGIPMVQVEPGCYLPHPIVQDVLLRELQACPEEYQMVQEGRADVLSERQPLVAAQAYLDAGATGKARQVLLSTLPELASAEELASARKLLLELVRDPEDEFYLRAAQAVFDAGGIVEGMAMAERALRAQGHEREAHVVLGSMFQRTGNAQQATRHIEQALHLSTDPETLVRLRVQLALNLVQQVDDAPALIRAEAEASRVLTYPALPQELVVLSRVVLTLSLAGRGRRTEARAIAHMAQDAAEGLSPDSGAVLALLYLANFFTDDGDFQAARELLRRVEVLRPSSGDLKLQFYLSSCRFSFRSGDLDACRFAGRLASDQALLLRHTPAHLEALTFLYILSLLPTVQQQHDWLYQQLIQHHGRQDALISTTNILQEIFLHRRSPRRIVGDLGAPPELRCLLTVYQLGQQPRNELLQEEARVMRNRLGPGVVAGYAQLLRVELPAHLAETRLTMQILSLRTLPEIYVQGERLDLPNRLLLPLLALVWSGRLGSEHIPQVFGNWPAASFRRAYSDLRKVLHEATGMDDPLGNQRGIHDLSSWRLDLDYDQLLAGDLSTLEQLYKTQLYGAANEEFLFLHELRALARRRVRERLSEFEIQMPQEARRTRERLIARDVLLYPG